MTPTQWFLIVVVVVPLGLALANRLRADLAALIIAIILGIAQFAGMSILGPPNTPGAASKAITGLSQSVIVTLLGLFIITRALEKTGVTRWIARQIVSIGGKSEPRLISLFAATAALLSLLMNNLAAGALLLPSAMEAARRTGIRPSKLLIPLAYGTLLGGAATYFTTANIIVSDLLTAANPPQAPLHVLDFTPTGGLIALAGIAFMALFGRRLLPDRASLTDQMAPHLTGSELEDAYRLAERLWEAKVLPGSPLIGQTLAQARVGERLGLAIAAILRGRHAILAPSLLQSIQLGDVMLIVGREERVNQLGSEGLKIGAEKKDGYISKRGISPVEVIPAPHSIVLGHTLKDLEFRKKWGMTAVALWRNGQSHRTDVADFKLQLGDSFLMVGPREKINALHNSRNFIVLEPDLGDQPIQRRQVALSIGITLGAILISILGFPVFLAMLAGAVLVILTGLLTAEEAYRSVEWQAIFLIAGMYSVSLAMVQTGLAAVIGQAMVGIVAPFGPLGLAAGAYLLTAVLTQAMGGQVTALVTGPIAISAAIHFHVSPQALAVVTAIGCSASFLTPMAHPVNILMIGPGNYHFGDYFRLGWGLTIVSFVMLLVGLIVFWHL